MARISLKGIIAFVIMACGTWLITSAMVPQLQMLVGSQWYITLLAGIILIVIAAYFGRRSL